MVKNFNDYQNQKLRGLKRKFEYVLKRGGKCEKCGYNKNLAVLEFHHRDAWNKKFQIDLRHFANSKLEKLEDELTKCDLLCANCHREIHNPNLKFENVPNIIKEAQDKLSFSNVKEYIHNCIYCGKPIMNYTSGKKYCSEECKWNDKKYPSMEEIDEQYKIFGSWNKVAKHFGITRKIIAGIRKRNI